MKASTRYVLARWSALILSMLLACEPSAIAQTELSSLSSPPDAQPHAAFSQQELDQMLAPIALYPDPLLSQMLMAASYPLEVVEAARWSRATPYLRGEAAVREVRQQDWDPSVKSLVAFPQVLQMMDERLDWTERLGDAFLGQQRQVMDTVQNLRQKAYAAGNLQSSDQIRVTSDGQIITIEPAATNIVYVPYYDPIVVYGPWWWDEYPPVFWGPWPGYYFVSGFAWDFGITISAGFFFGDCDWGHHRVNVVNVTNYYYVRRHDERHPEHEPPHAPGAWQHDPDHRHGVPYRDESLRQRFGRGSAAEERREFRGYEQPALGERNEREARQMERAPLPPNRPAFGGGQARQRNEPMPPSRREEPRGSRPAPEPSPPALEDIGHGQHVRDYSSRGRSSYEGTMRNEGGARSTGGISGGGRMEPGGRGH